MKPHLNLIRLDRTSILEQLRIEEALLRVDNRNWCLIHENPDEAIVLGISAQPEQVIDFSLWHQKPVSMIRRFSGGGTVFIDKNCLMTTFICNQTDLNVPSFPQPVFEWSFTFYRPLFNGLKFALRENDYVIGEKKFGGNAQYMTKNRWLHHTSFLWDYDENNMKYLKIPPKIPQYRAQRDHQDFLCKLKDYVTNKETFLRGFMENLHSHFTVVPADHLEVKGIALLPHRKSTHLMEIKRAAERGLEIA